MTYHPVTQQITSLLDENQCDYETFEHEPVLTSEEAANVRHGYGLEQGAKAIILRIKESKAKKYFVMIVFPGNRKFDKQKVKTLFNAKDIRFATTEEVNDITNGVQSGGVPPFAHLFDLPLYVDESLFQNERIVFNAGDRQFSIGMLSADYQKLANPNIGSIT